MDNSAVEHPKFPGELLDWAGHRSGGVRRLFDDASGRPSGAIIQTRLLDRLNGWVEEIGNNTPSAPTLVLLVGGPGNGKTEAVELTVRALDAQLGLGDRLIAAMVEAFSPAAGGAVPRLVSIDLMPLSNGRLDKTLQLVQDASVADPLSPGKTPAELLVAEIEAAESSARTVYLSCVNRGVLDDALILAIEARRSDVRRLLEAIVRAAGLSPSAPACWPLQSYPSVAIWPMDVESLFVALRGDLPSPATQLLDIATDESAWRPFGSCPAAEGCPFCTSRKLLAGAPHRQSFLTVLRWYELATGKRWSFRDLFSLFSYCLAGEPAPEGNPLDDPCQWAARLLALEGTSGSKVDRLRAPYALVAAQYQHALFGQWPRSAARVLRQDLRDLKLDATTKESQTLHGLVHFLDAPRAGSITTTLRTQLEGLCAALDPALASPDEEIPLSAATTIKLRDLDTRFSQSVREGLGFIRKNRCLTVLETKLLQLLAEADDLLSTNDVRRRRPLAAGRVQAMIRDYACRLVRRSLGVRCGMVQDASTLANYEKVIEGDASLMEEAANQVARLLNSNDRFVVTLNTTFGEPLPPEPRRAVLTTDKQRVRPLPQPTSGRPVATMRFLSVGPVGTAQSIPLTYELFRSVGELQIGMLPASLPRAVVALLDTTRARLAGRIVRNEELLDGAELRIGLRNDVIVRQTGRFVVRAGELG